MYSKVVLQSFWRFFILILIKFGQNGLKMIQISVFFDFFYVIWHTKNRHYALE